MLKINKILKQEYVRFVCLLFFVSGNSKMILFDI